MIIPPHCILTQWLRQKHISKSSILIKCQILHLAKVQLSLYKFTPNLKWNSYIWHIAKDDGKLVGFRKYQVPPTMLYLYKTQIRLKMEFCRHICAGAAKCSLCSFDRVQKYLTVGDELISALQPLSHRHNIANLSLP